MSPFQQAVNMSPQAQCIAILREIVTHTYPQSHAAAAMYEQAKKALAALDDPAYYRAIERALREG